MADEVKKPQHGISDDPHIAFVARPNDLVLELDKLVRRSQRYEPEREAAYYNFRNACFHCGKLMSYFWSQYQRVRRKETKPE